MSATNASNYQAAPPESEAEAALRQVFMEAKGFSVQVAHQLAGWRDPGPDAAFPSNTLRKLEMAARIHFTSGCSLLFEAWLSYATDAHVRALLDLYAHVAWILDKGGLSAPMSPSGRARCYELGMARALDRELTELESLATRAAHELPASSLPLVQRLVAELSALHVPDQCSCDGKGRGFRTVGPTLRTLSENAAANIADRVAGAELLHGLWRYSSRLIHHAGFELSPATN